MDCPEKDASESERSFSSRLFSGAFWNSVAQFGAQGLNFLLFIVLARLLESKDFGLLSMVTIVVGFVGYFSEFGLQASLIKKETIDEKDCATVFWASLVLGCLVYVFLYLVAPLVALFYNQPELTKIMRVVSIVFPIGVFSFLPITLETKVLRYDRIAKVRLGSLLLSAGIAMFLALNGYGIWALVFQLLSMKFFEAAGLLLITRYFPCFVFSIASFWEAVSFGKHIVVNNLIKYLSENIDYLIIGKLLGANLLGVYTIAFRISKYPIEKLWQIVGRILFPAFASIQNDKEQIKRLFFTLSATGAIVTVPVLAVIFVCTNEFILLTVGEKWLPACGIIKILIGYLVLMSFSLADESVMTLLNIKKLNFWKMAFSIIFVLLAIVVAGKYGLKGIAFVYTCVFSFYWIFIKILTMRTLLLPIHTLIRLFLWLLSYVFLVFLTAVAIHSLVSFQYIFLNLLSVIIGSVFSSFLFLVYHGAFSLQFPFVKIGKFNFHTC